MFAALLLVLGPSALAQTGSGTSNGGGLFGPETGAENDFRSTGFIPFSISGTRSLLQENGFQIIGDEYSEQEKSHLFAALAGKQPILFILQNCEGGDCIFFKIVLPMAMEAFGVSLTDSQYLQLSSALPFGYLMPERSQPGLVSLRYGMPMAKECARDCLLSKIGMFFGEASAVQQAFMTMGTRQSATLEPSDRQDLLAALQHNYHYETLRVESGMRAAELTRMNDFLGTMALREGAPPPTLSLATLRVLARDPDLEGLSHTMGLSDENDMADGWVLYPPMGDAFNGDTTKDMGISFPPLFEQE